MLSKLGNVIKTIMSSLSIRLTKITEIDTLQCRLSGKGKVSFILTKGAQSDKASWQWGQGAIWQNYRLKISLLPRNSTSRHLGD